MAETEDAIKELVKNIEHLKFFSSIEDISNEQNMKIYIEKVSALFKILKELPDEITVQYKTQMSEYCLYLGQAIEALHQQQLAIKEEINLLNKKMKAHKLYSK